MADFEKYPEEILTLDVDFSARLDTGESLTGTPTVTILDSAGNDVSSDFGSPSASISGTKVVFTLGAAGSGTQTKRSYAVKVQVDTDALPAQHFEEQPVLQMRGSSV